LSAAYRINSHTATLKIMLNYPASGKTTFSLSVTLATDAI
jgi:hypothetical protein